MRLGAVEGAKRTLGLLSGRGEFYTAGGAVLGVSHGVDLEPAVERAYQACEKIRFEGAHYRKDIAGRVLKK